MYRSVCSTLMVVALLGALSLVRPGTAGEDKAELSPQEKKIVELTNAVRKEKKLKPLRVSPLLTEVARKHSANMAKQGKLSHVLDGKGVDKRMREAGYVMLGWAENIFVNRDKAGAAEEGFQWWMESPPHRANILKANLQEVGIGTALNGKGQIYFTQVFGTPRKQR